MAEIEIVYRYYYCDSNDLDELHCSQCHSCCADGMGCKEFKGGYDEPCEHAKYKKVYKGISCKNYEISKCDYTFDPWLNCVEVKIGKKVYDCERVVLNGNTIYEGGMFDDI